MYKAAHNFSFSLSNVGELQEVVGQLIFQSTYLNEFGSLNTREEIEGFPAYLNSLTELPEYWTLETLSKELFVKIKPFFKNLQSVNLSLKQYPDRVVEYSDDTEVLEESQWSN